MPKYLKTSVKGKIPVAEQYTCGQIAFLMGCAHRTAAKLIDSGRLKGFRLMSGKKPEVRERRVLHKALIAFINEYPDYAFMLGRFENYKPEKDFGKEYRKKWAKKLGNPRKKSRFLVQRELDSGALASGLEFGEALHESQELDLTEPESS
jgi:hypothetical protein